MATNYWQIIQWIFCWMNLSSSLPQWKIHWKLKTKTNEDKRMVNLEFFQNFFFLDIYHKNQHIHFLVHGHPYWSTFGLHPVRGPTAVNYFFKKLNHGSWTIKSNQEKRSSMVWLYGPWCKSALNTINGVVTHEWVKPNEWWFKTLANIVHYSRLHHHLNQ